MKANEGKSFIGSYVLGMGFTFDDTDKKGVATPLAEMERLIAKNPSNKERILRYVGGEEVNDSPTHAHHRYVINFDDFPLRRNDLGSSWANADDDRREGWLRIGIVPLDYPDPVATDWPDLLDIVEQKVKPDRLKDNRENYRRYWWRFAERRPGLFDALKQIDSAIVLSRVGNAFAFAFIDARIVPSERLVVFCYQKQAAFCTLQSRVHETWTRFLGSTLKDDLMYAPEDCFQTFPFPSDFASNSALEEAGRTYYEQRGQIMLHYSKGLTATYNEFHNPNSDWTEIVELRGLQDCIDRAVLEAYGWTDLKPRCDFFREFDDEIEQDDDGRQRKIKFRYRWPDDFRDEVLVRLLKLNRQQAVDEGLAVSSDMTAASTPDVKPRKASNKKSKAKKTTQDAATGLFAVGKGET